MGAHKPVARDARDEEQHHEDPEDRWRRWLDQGRGPWKGRQGQGQESEECDRARGGSVVEEARLAQQEWIWQLVGLGERTVFDCKNCEKGRNIEPLYCLDALH